MACTRVSSCCSPNACRQAMLIKGNGLSLQLRAVGACYGGPACVDRVLHGWIAWWPLWHFYPGWIVPGRFVTLQATAASRANDTLWPIPRPSILCLFQNTNTMLGVQPSASSFVKSSSLSFWRMLPASGLSSRLSLSLTTRSAIPVNSVASISPTMANCWSVRSNGNDKSILSSMLYRCRWFDSIKRTSTR